jgi:hypothetical protein
LIGLFFFVSRRKAKKQDGEVTQLPPYEDKRETEMTNTTPLRYLEGDTGDVGARLQNESAPKQ